ncbi:ParA family protein [Pusillimonas caeni]|uniref:ParA family protein n=1 Tax=Pusillimonas caeni TaxID=1348472 RepID=UPI000E59B50F|nr:ParA family protein [Pusillimonas caeni]TFL14029.1 ParA family protein [Pusillimonas caeni]
MKTLVVAQGKGGVGKTACAAHIAFFARDAGLRVLIVDLDTGNLSKTLADSAIGIASSELFSEGPPASLAAKPAGQGGGALELISADALLANLVYLSLEAALSRFVANLEALSPGYDLCVIDTAPGLGIALAAALHAADAVISPVEMEDYSIEGIKFMMRTILNARSRNPKLSFLGILPSRVDRRNPRQVGHLAQVQHAHEALLVPFVIGLRSSVAEALAQGVPVWTLRKTSARAAGAEMRALGSYVVTKMGVAQ